jgi:hypothetical protein
MNRNHHFIFNCSVAFLLLFLQNVVAQPKADLYRLQQKYADQSAVYTNIHQQINIELINGKFDIKMQVAKESMMLDEHAALYSEGSVSYSSLVFLSNIEAATLYPNEKHYKEIKVEEYKDKDRFSSSIFFDDVREKKFTYPSVTKGAKRKLLLHYDIKDPYLLTSFMLQEYIPAENITLTIVCPNNMEIGYKIFNDDSVKVAFETRKEKGKTIYEWKCNNVNAMESESGAPGHLYYMPHIVYYIKNYTIDGKKEKVLESVEDLHAYYSKLIKDVNTETYQPLKKLVDSLTANLTEDEQKVKAIYYWVKDNIKYIAFESGYEGFIPAQSKDIFEKRFGDCKGMASILTKMLDYANIPAYLTWIGTRDLPYSYYDNPTSGSDNHMIAAIKLKGSYIFLDGTSTNTPFGYPSQFIQGKEAIVHLPGNTYEIVKVPEVEDSLNVNIDSVMVEITSDLKLTGTGYSKYTGFERDEIIEMLDDHSREEKMTMLKNYFQKGSNKFMLENYTETNTFDRDKTLEIQYKFNLSDYLLQSGRELYINMNLEKIYSKSAIEKTRIYDIEYKYKHRISNTVVLKIPDGYELSYLPANDSLNNPLFSFSIRYKQSGSTVTLNTEVVLKCLSLYKKDFEVWNDFTARLRKNYAESVAFKAK